MKYSAFILIFAFLFAAAFGGGFPAAASEESEGLTVITVEVDGNRAISSSTITAKIKTKPGSVFSQQIANDDIKRLYALGYFTDVAIDVGDYKEGVKVTVIVEEKSVIKSIVFEGNKKINTARLKKAIHIKAGDMLDYGKLAEKQDHVQAALAEKDWTKTPNQAAQLLGLNAFEARALVAAEVAGSPVTTTQLLWDQYDPQYKVWIPFAAIGVLAAIALAVFGQMAKRWADMNA